MALILMKPLACAGGDTGQDANRSGAFQLLCKCTLRIRDSHSLSERRFCEQLQQELHVATTKIDEQQAEIARLKEELELRPRNVDERVDELQREVAQLRVIAGEARIAARRHEGRP